MKGATGTSDASERGEETADAEGLDLDAPASTEDPLLEEIAAAPSRPVRTKARGLEPGLILDDHYEIDSVLGEGGMGIVYLARDLRLDRLVALKLHRWADDRSRGRLLREARAMAKLTHPNVLTVHEVGTWHGYVFIATEYVPGTTARVWAKAEGRRPEDVLEVYRKAGQGLAAAHAAGLVHRDFKPDNVLVGEDGRVHVSDFGLAQAKDDSEEAPGLTSTERLQSLASLTASGSLTVTGARVGTPAYMAPEQFMGEAVDARADQFSFCVALYEGLYGTLPFAGRNITAVAVAIGRGPTPPSRPGVSNRVRKALARGLAAVPDERFPELRGLLKQLDPKRHAAWALITGAAAVAVAATGWLVGDNAPQLAPCADASGPIARVWTTAQSGRVASNLRAAGLPDDLSDHTLRRLDGYALHWETERTRACEEQQDASVWSDRLRDRSHGCFADRLRRFSSTVHGLELVGRDELLSTLGSLELPPLSSCREPDYLLAQVSPDRAVADAVERRRDELADIRSRLRSDDPATIEAELAGLAEDVEALGYAPLTAETQLVRGKHLVIRDEPKRAEQVTTDAFFIAQRAQDGSLSSRIAETLALLVGFELGRGGEGLVWARHAVNIAEGGGVDVVERAEAWATLGRLHDTTGDYKAAEQHYERALGMLNPRDPLHAHARGNALVSLCALYGGLGRTQEALRVGREAVEVLDALLGPDSFESLPAYGDIGYALNAAGRYREGLAEHERVLKITERIFGPGHHAAIGPYLNMGVSAHGMGDRELARSHYTAAAELAEKHFGPNHPDVGLALGNIALLQADTGEYTQALEGFRRAHTIIAETWGPSSGEAITQEQNVAEMLLNLDRCDEGLPIWERLTQSTHDKQGESAAYAVSLSGLGACLDRTGQHERALETLERAVTLAEEGSAVEAVRATAKYRLARALWTASGDRELPRIRELTYSALSHLEARSSSAELAELREWMAEVGIAEN